MAAQSSATILKPRSCASRGLHRAAYIARLGSARLYFARLYFARLYFARLYFVRLYVVRLNFAPLGIAPLGIAPLGIARLCFAASDLVNQQLRCRRVIAARLFISRIARLF